MHAEIITHADQVRYRYVVVALIDGKIRTMRTAIPSTVDGVRARLADEVFDRLGVDTLHAGPIPRLFTLINSPGGE